MGRIIGPILALFGIVLVVSLVAGVAYSAGLAAAGVVAAPGSTVVTPVAGYGWYAGPWFGFGFGILHFLAFLVVIVLIVGLIRFAVGAGRRGPRRGWGSEGYGHPYGPAGWDHGPEAGGPPSGDPREAWIRARLDDWHRTAHAAAGPATGSATTATPGTDPAGSGRPPSGTDVPGTDVPGSGQPLTGS